MPYASFLSCLLLALCIGSGCETTVEQGKMPPLRIAVAANARAALEEICTAFEKETGTTTELISGSSGKLATQIQMGAPYDLFLSANLAYPESLLRSGHAKGPVQIYAHGALQLWLRDQPPQARFPDVLMSESIQRIAMANPSLAPYGAAAEAALANSKLSPVLKEKIVLGESIAQVNQYIQTNAVDAAITGLDFPSSQGFPSGRFVPIPADLYPPVLQGAVIVDNGKEGSAKNPRQFLEYLSGRVAKKILRDHGYGTGNQ